MYRPLLGIFLLTFSLSALATEEFQKTLAAAGIKPEVIEILVKNDLTSRDILCLTTTEELTKVGISLGQAKLIMKFCTPEKPPAELGDVNKMSELDLLNRLATNPQDTNVLEALQSKRLVKKAEERTTSWAVVEIDDNGTRKLDAAATLEYLKYLNLPTAPALLNKNRDGKLIESVEILGKTDGQILVHPLFEGQCISSGYDSTGLDWSKVPAETMKALLWARETGHQSFLRLNLDGDRVYAEVAKEKIDDVFVQEILKDYQLAIKKKDRRAMFTDLNPTEAQLEACKKKVDKPATENATHSKTSLSQRPKTFTNSIGMEFVLIPAGKFMMGPSFDEVSSGIASASELPRHEVTVQAFYMSQYEVTQEQWLSVMGSNPATFKNDKVGGSSRKHPIESVRWEDVQEFVKRLNAIEKDKGYVCRLPTEAEWEYAARAGTQTVYYFGDDATQLGEYAWYVQNSGFKTHPVGEKKPNAWGLYDMYGNVWEWNEDVWHGNYNGAPTDGRAWIEGGEQQKRLLRGGSYDTITHHCRSAVRGRFNVADNNFGFRLSCAVLS